MGVELTAKWWKGNKPTFLNTADVTEAFKLYEEAIDHDLMRDDVYKPQVPKALEHLMLELGKLEKKCSDSAHAETKKNAKELYEKATKELDERHHLYTTLVRLDTAFKAEFEKLAHEIGALSKRLFVAADPEGNPGVAGSAHGPLFDVIVEVSAGAKTILEIRKLLEAADRTAGAEARVFARYASRVDYLVPLYKQAGKVGEMKSEDMKKLAEEAEKISTAPLTGKSEFHTTWQRT